MILSIFLVLTFIGVISFFNRSNKFLNVIAMYFFSIVLIMFVSAIYVSRLSNYYFPLQIDYDFYIWLSKLKIHINSLVIICNMSIGLFMFSTLYLIKLIKKYSKKFLVIASVLIIGVFMFTNSPSFLWSMYLKINSASGNAFVYKYIVILLRNFNITLIVVHFVLPFVYLWLYYKSTKIPLKKKNALTYMSCLAIMEILIYAIFVKGPFAEFVKMKHYVSENLKTASLFEIASLLGVNSSYLSRIFKETEGTGFQEYVTECRLKIARELLLTTDMKIFEIALQTGYVTNNYFSKVFKKVYGMNPNEYRELYSIHK